MLEPRLMSRRLDAVQFFLIQHLFPSVRISKYLERKAHNIVIESHKTLIESYDTLREYHKTNFSNMV